MRISLVMQRKRTKPAFSRDQGVIQSERSEGEQSYQGRLTKEILNLAEGDFNFSYAKLFRFCNIGSCLSLILVLDFLQRLPSLQRDKRFG